MVAHAIVGHRTKRIDSPPKLTGQERFTADLKLPGLLHARPVGSPYAHARILGIDKSAALAIPGVVAVLTAADLTPQDLGGKFDLGALLLGPYAEAAGISVNPRLGVWDPLTLQVIPGGSGL